MHRYWFAVQCGPYFGAFQAMDSRAAACIAILHWTVDNDERCSREDCRVTVVVAAGGQPLEAYEFIQTDDLLRSLKLPASTRSANQRKHRRS